MGRPLGEPSYIMSHHPFRLSPEGLMAHKGSFKKRSSPKTAYEYCSSTVKISISFEFNHHLNFDCDIIRQCIHPDGGPRMTAPVTEQIHHQV